MRLATCPTSTDLERLFLGGIPAADAEAMEHHVLACAACLAQLKKALAAKETLADALHHSTRNDSTPAVEELIRKLQTLRPAGNAMLEFACTACQKKLSVKAEMAGKKAKCPKCGEVVPIPVQVGRPQEPSSIETVAPPAHADAHATSPPPDQADSTHTSRVPDARYESNLTDFLGKPQEHGEIGRLGKYRILRVLGHGGMGVVYQAEDTMLERTVALKAMLPGVASSTGAGKRFLREARTMAKVEHDNIVRIYQVDEDRGVPFLAMEFLKGEPLDERLKRDDPITLSETLRIGREIAQGLAAAHAHGLIHRDIKPANIWLENRQGDKETRRQGDGKSADSPCLPVSLSPCLNFRVKILDFGLARAASQESGLTQQGAIVGTPAYMSPEQSRGETLDARSDLFSLGVVLYRLTTGKQPFVGKDTISTLVEVAMHAPPPPAQINADVPAGVSELIMKLLEKDASRRIATADEVVHALARLEAEVGRQGDKETRRQGDKQIAPGGSTVTYTPQAPTSSPLPLYSGGEGPGVRGSKRRWLVAASIVLGLAAVVALVVGIIRINTPEGDYVIETDDPDFAFSVSKGTVILEDKLKKRTFHVKAVKNKGKGEWELEITDPANDTVVTALTLTIRRGEKAAGLKLWFEARDKAIANKAGPVDDVWIKMVQSLPAEKQVDAVVAKLKDLNPEFDGVVTKQVKNGVVTEFGLKTITITNISPLQALTGLKSFTCWRSPTRSPLTDVSPLRKLKLTYLDLDSTNVTDLAPVGQLPLDKLFFYHTPVEDLAPIKDLKLHSLGFNHSNVADLSPIGAMRLNDLGCGFTKVSTLSPLSEMNLNYLDCQHTQVSDLSPLKKMPLTTLYCNHTEVRDLTPLKQMQLGYLDCQYTNVVSLSPLTGMPLKTLICENTLVSDLVPLKNMPLTLLACSYTPLEDLTPVATMKLLTSFGCSYTKVSTLAPLKGLKLTVLGCNNTTVSDLGPLTGMPLEILGFSNTQVADLLPLKGMNLSQLYFDNTFVKDLTPLRNMPLRKLSFKNTSIANLSILKDMPLTNLDCSGTKVTDLSPLVGMPLKGIDCDFVPERDTAVLRSMKSLETINGKPAAEFWKEVDAKNAPTTPYLEYLHTIKTGDLCSDFAFTADGKFLYTGGSTALRKWETGAGKFVSAIETQAMRLAITPDAKAVLAFCANPHRVEWIPLAEPQKGVVQEDLEKMIGGHSGHPAISSDGKRAVVGLAAGRIAVFEINDGKLEAMKTWATGLKGGIVHTAFRPGRNDQVLLGSSNSGVVLWNIAKSQVDVTPIKEGAVNLAGVDFLAFAAKGDRFGYCRAITDPGVFNVDRLSSVKFPREKVRGVAFVAGDRWIVSIHEDKKLRLWDADKLDKELAVKDVNGFPMQIAVSPHGDVIAVNTMSGIEVWRVTSGAARPNFVVPALVHTLNKHTGPAETVAINADGSVGVSAGADNRMRFWDLVSGLQINSEVLTSSPTVAGISRDGRHALVGEHRKFHVWDVQKREAVAVQSVGNAGHMHRVAFSPDDKTVMTTGWSGPGGDRKVRWWRLDKEGLEKPVQNLMMPTDVGAFAFADSDHAVVACYHGTVHTIDLLTGNQTKPVKLPSVPAEPMDFSGDGSLLLFIHRDKETPERFTLFDWRLSKTLQQHSIGGKVLALALSPDGKWAVFACKGESAIRLWDLVEGKEAGKFESHKSEVLSVAISRDGRLVLSGCKDGSVCLWRMPGGKEGTPVAAWPDYATPVELSFTTKLGVKINAKVKSADCMPHEVLNLAAFQREPKGPKLVMTLGNGAALLMPWPLVKSIVARDKQHQVTLIDGASHVGGILTKVTMDDGKQYDLASVTELTVVGAKDAKPPAPKRALVRLQLSKPTEQAFQVHPPEFLTTPARGDSFKMKVGGEVIQGNLSDFSRVEVAPGNANQGKDGWSISVQNPPTPAKSGTLEMPNGWWWLYAELPNGCLLVHSNHDMSGGFTLDKQAAQDKIPSTGNLQPDPTGRLGQLPGHKAEIRCFAFSKDGALLLTGSVDKTVRLWDVAKAKELLCFKNHEAPGPAAITSVAFLPDGKHALSVDANGNVLEWDLDKGKETSRLRTGLNNPVSAISPDGRRVLVGKSDGDLEVWDRESKQTIFAEKNVHATSGAFAADGKRIVIGRSGAIRLWDLTSKKELGKFASVLVPQQMQSVALSTDGRRVLSASYKTIQLWDITTESKEPLKPIATRAMPSWSMSVAFTPDGKRFLASDSFNSTFFLWETAAFEKDANSEPLWRFTGHEREITIVAFAPDGELIVSGDREGDVRLWRMPGLTTPKQAVGEIRRYLGHADGINFLKLSPDGKSFLSGSSGELWLWDIDKATERIRFPEAGGNVMDGGFSSDGLRVIGPGPIGAFIVWDLKPGDKVSEVTRVKIPTWVESAFFLPQSRVFCADKSLGRIYDMRKTELPMRFLGARAVPGKNGLRILSADGKHLYLWNSNGTEVSNVELPRPAFRIALHEDGRHALAAVGNDVVQWDMDNKKEGKRLETPASVFAVAISPDGKRALTGGFDKKLRYWNLETGQEIHCFHEHTGSVSAVVFLPDGKQALSASSDKTIRLWQLPAAPAPTKLPVGEVRVYGGHDKIARTVVFHPDGNWFLSGGDGKLFWWDIEKNTPVKQWTDSTKSFSSVGSFHTIHSLAISKDGSHLLSGSSDGVVRLWDVKKGKVDKHLELHKGNESGPHFVAFAPDDRFVLAASESGFVSLFAYPVLHAGKNTYGGFQGHFSKDANKLLTLERGILQTYHLDKPKRTFVNVADMNVCAFSPEGRYALCGGLDAMVYVWDMETKKQVHKMAGHKGTIQALAVSPDGKRALSGGGDSMMRLWDLEKGVEIRAFDGHLAPVVSVAFSPDGTQALSAGSTDKTIRLWQLP